MVKENLPVSTKSIATLSECLETCKDCQGTLTSWPLFEQNRLAGTKQFHWKTHHLTRGNYIISPAPLQVTRLRWHTTWGVWGCILQSKCNFCLNWMVLFWWFLFCHHSDINGIHHEVRCYFFVSSVFVTYLIPWLTLLMLYPQPGTLVFLLAD